MDRYQNLCECVQIMLTPEDDRRLRTAHISVYEEFAREVVNKGLRPMVTDPDCCACGGSGCVDARHAA